jgi:hypothetical protein
MPFPQLFLSRQLAAFIGAITVGAAAPTAAGAASPPTTTLVCTNLVSHASWQIHVDFERSTVDSNQRGEDLMARPQRRWKLHVGPHVR